MSKIILTEEQKEKQREATRRWRERHPDYYQKTRNKILEKKKSNTIKNIKMEFEQNKKYIAIHQLVGLEFYLENITFLIDYTIEVKET